MTELLHIASGIGEQQYPFEFSICTLVTRKAEYEEMLQSFLHKGFDRESCEYLYIDNSNGSRFDAFKGLNQFLLQAKGKYVILCHQDIIIHDHDRHHLATEIENIDRTDPNWAILANAGGVNFKWIATNLTQGSGNVIKEKNLPLRTKTVDENFILVKNSANLVLSHNLSGFHLYGADLCLIADILGFNAYVINFNIIHKSDGNADQGFYQNRKDFLQKYSHALRSRFITTTITRFYISGGWMKMFFNNLQPVKFLVRQYYKAFKRKKGYVLAIKKDVKSS